MREVHALVAELAADLEDAVHAAHDAALEVELRGDAQVALLVERVEVRGEGARVGAAERLLQDGRLDLEVALVLHEAPDAGDDPRAVDERLLDLGVHDEVDVALAVADLAVGEAVELLGQRAHGLGEHAQRLGRDGELAAVGAHDAARRLDDVAHVDGVEQRPACLVHRVDAAEQLDGARGILKVDEGELAVAAERPHAAADGEERVERALGAVLDPTVLALDVGDGPIDAALDGIGVDACIEQGLATVQARGALVDVLGLDGLICHGSLLFKTCAPRCFPQSRGAVVAMR